MTRYDHNFYAALRIVPEEIPRTLDDPELADRALIEALIRNERFMRDVSRPVCAEVIPLTRARQLRRPQRRRTDWKQFTADAMETTESPALR